MNDTIGWFWNWFVRHSDELTTDFLAQRYSVLSSEMRQALDEISQRSARLNWEIGPGSHKLYRLVLSPTVPANIPLCDELALRAPDLRDWEFISCKPPKPHPFVFSLHSLPEGLPYSIDARNWLCRVDPDRDRRMASVEFHCPVQLSLDDTNANAVAYTLLDNILGERRAMTTVSRCELCLATDDTANGIPINELADHIQAIVDG